jgi:hypothetical protein
MIIVETGLPPLPKTDTTLFVAEDANEATQRLAQTIRESPQFSPPGQLPVLEASTATAIKLNSP